MSGWGGGNWGTAENHEEDSGKKRGDCIRSVSRYSKRRRRKVSDTRDGNKTSKHTLIRGWGGWGGFAWWRRGVKEASIKALL